MKFTIGLFFGLSISAACAQMMTTTGPVNEDYRRGWCDAINAMMHNRDHYRAMMEFPHETLEDSLKRILAKWPPAPPEGFKGSDILNLTMAGIDLYVMVPDSKCAVQ